MKVGILDLRGDEANEVASAIGGVAFQCDTTDEAQLAAAMEGVNAAFGGIDILVNNAGLIAQRKDWATWTKEEVERFAQVNYIGYFLTIKAAHPYLKASGRGRIINVASRTFFMGNPGQTPYVSAKGAVIGLSWNMAKELGGDNITVNAVMPDRSRPPARWSTTTRRCSTARCRTRRSRRASTRSTSPPSSPSSPATTPP